MHSSDEQLSGYTAVCVFRSLCFAFLLCVLVPGAAAAQSASDDEPRVSFSGFVQPQYELRTRNSTTSDRALFRRIVLTLEAAISTSWAAEVQVDAGPVASGDGDRLIVKDLWLRYTGWEKHGILVTFGNQKMPFSRALIGSSSRRLLLERPITADRGLGSPGRAVAIRAEGSHRNKTTYWSAALGSSRQSPEPDEIRVDGIAEAEAGWNEGRILAGRVEFQPLGEVPQALGDLERGALRVAVAVGGYEWWNDGGVERHDAGLVDADRVRGVEVSGGLRDRRVSIDAEFEHIVSRAVDASANIGLYEKGTAIINKGSVEAGYMLLRRRLDALVGFDVADARTFETQWRRFGPGMNLYVNGHRLKFSLMHRESFNDRGTRRARSRTTYLQAHFAF